MANLSKATTPVFLIVVIAACLVGLVFLGSAFLDSVKERETMDLTESGAAQAAIPPIDAAAPINTQTATFALG